MSRSAVPEEAVYFHRAPGKAPQPTPTSLSEYDAFFTEPWRKEALCIDQPASLFFPESSQSNLQGKRICEMCPVRLDCLSYAVTTYQEFGIWGGTVGKERGTIRKLMAKGMGIAEALYTIEKRRQGRSKMREKDKPAPKPVIKKVGDTLVEETGVNGVVRVWGKVKIPA